MRPTTAALGAATTELAAARATYEAAYADWAAAETLELRAAFAAIAVANEVVAAADAASKDAASVREDAEDGICLHDLNTCWEGICDSCPEDLRLATNASRDADDAVMEAQGVEIELWQDLRHFQE